MPKITQLDFNHNFRYTDDVKATSHLFPDLTIDLAEVFENRSIE